MAKGGTGKDPVRLPCPSRTPLVAGDKDGACLTLQPSTVNGMELGAKKCQDSLFLKYGLEPPDIPKFCDSCNAAFYICHYPDFKKGGPITARHNELHDGIMDLSGKAFTPTHKRDEHLIFSGRAMLRPKAQTAGTKPSPSTKKEARYHKTEGQPSDL